MLGHEAPAQVSLLLMACLAFAGSAAGQNAPSYERYSDVPLGTSPGGTPPPATPRSLGPGSNLYTDRVSFQAANPGLTFEHFSGTSVAADSVEPCAGPFNSLTNNSCFPAGAILAGIEFDNLQGSDSVVLTPSFLGVSCVAVGPNFFSDDAVIRFGGSVDAFGAEIVCGLFAGTVDIEIFGAGGSLGTSVSPCGLPGSFWGVDSAEPITSIQFTDGAGQVGELFCNVEFGARASVPTAPPWALVGLGVLLATVAMLVLRGQLQA